MERLVAGAVERTVQRRIVVDAELEHVPQQGEAELDPRPPHLAYEEVAEGAAGDGRHLVVVREGHVAEEQVAARLQPQLVVAEVADALVLPLDARLQARLVGGEDRNRGEAVDRAEQVRAVLAVVAQLLRREERGQGDSAEQPRLCARGGRHLRQERRRGGCRLHVEQPAPLVPGPHRERDVAAQGGIEVERAVEGEEAERVEIEVDALAADQVGAALDKEAQPVVAKQPRREPAYRLAQVREEQLVLAGVDALAAVAGDARLQLDRVIAQEQVGPLVADADLDAVGADAQHGREAAAVVVLHDDAQLEPGRPHRQVARAQPPQRLVAQVLQGLDGEGVLLLAPRDDLPADGAEVELLLELRELPLEQGPVEDVEGQERLQPEEQGADRAFAEEDDTVDAALVDVDDDLRILQRGRDGGEIVAAPPQKARDAALDVLGQRLRRLAVRGQIEDVRVYLVGHCQVAAEDQERAGRRGRGGGGPAHEALFRSRRLFALAPYRSPRGGPPVRAGAGGSEDEKDPQRRRFLHHQRQRGRAGPPARRRPGAHRGSGDRAVPRRPEARGEARARRGYAGALPAAGVAQLHCERAAQELQPAVPQHHARARQAGDQGGAAGQVRVREPAARGETVPAGRPLYRRRCVPVRHDDLGQVHRPRSVALPRADCVPPADQGAAGRTGRGGRGEEGESLRLIRYRPPAAADHSSAAAAAFGLRSAAMRCQVSRMPWRVTIPTGPVDPGAPSASTSAVGAPAEASVRRASSRSSSSCSRGRRPSSRSAAAGG